MEKVTGRNFDNGFANWQDYQQAPWGRLRYRVAQANLQRYLPAPPARILDLGGGNGLDTIPLVCAAFVILWPTMNANSTLIFMSS